MQIIDTFSGIGGFSLAGNWLGWRPICFCEIDPWCQKVIKKHWPDVSVFDDIKELTYEKILGGTKWNPSEPTIIVGGFPCQPFSAAGKRKGKNDNRYLWPEMLRVIREIKPAYVVGENVAGLLSMENGRTLERILLDLEDEGYQVEVFVIPACGVGAWHRRDRVWIVAYHTDTGIETMRRERENTISRCQDAADPGLFRPKECQEQAAGIEQCGKGDAANTEIPKRQSTGNTWPRGNGFTDLCQDVSDTDNERPQGRECRELPECSSKQFIGQGNSQNDGTNGQPESCLGGVADDVPTRMDGYFSREPEGIPRVAIGIKDRVNRLKGLGNAVVPQVVYEIFKAIDEQNQRSPEGKRN